MNQPAGWVSSLSDFRGAESSLILNSLGNFVRDYSPLQEFAWSEEISILKDVVGKLATPDDSAMKCGIILEYRLPYENRRPDVILLGKEAVTVLEFKSKARATQADQDQVAAYARDLRAYHKECHERTVYPVLVLTRAHDTRTEINGVTIISPNRLSEIIEQLPKGPDGEQILIERFLAGDSYKPLPTLVQAARELFHSGTIRDIWRAKAATDPAVESIASIAKEAARTKTRHLVLVTGVPGSGKTLVGMRSVHSPLLDELSVNRNDGKPSVPGLYLTGNMPLSNVLQYALKKAGGGGQTFVRHIKGYLDHYVGHSERTPAEHLLVFDEAQRAFDESKVADTHSKWEFQLIASEPELFVQICDRMPDWSVLVGLIGTGQEIHVGEEKGLTQWRQALESSPNDWIVHLPDQLAETFEKSELPTSYDKALNLEVEVRFHYAQKLHQFVEAVLAEADPVKASAIAESVLGPNGEKVDGMKLYVTRSLEAAKEYLVERYSETAEARFGIVASSRDKDLPAFQVNNDFLSTSRLRLGPWFTEGDDHDNSCRALEQTVTEFGCQGLELDMALVAWGTDLVITKGEWSNDKAKRYQTRGRSTPDNPFQMRINAYRVLLTRGRDGSIIFIPELTELDETYKFLLDCGIPALTN